MLAGFILTNSNFSSDYILKRAKIKTRPHASNGPGKKSNSPSYSEEMKLALGLISGFPEELTLNNKPTLKIPHVIVLNHHKIVPHLVPYVIIHKLETENRNRLLNTKHETNIIVFT